MDLFTPLILLAWIPPIRLWLAIVCLLSIGLTSLTALNIASNILNRILLPSLSEGTLGVGIVISYMLVAILTIEAALQMIKFFGAVISYVALSDVSLEDDVNPDDAKSPGPTTPHVPTVPPLPFKAAVAVGFLVAFLCCAVWSVLAAFLRAVSMTGYGLADRLAAGAAVGIDAFLVSSTLVTLLSVAVVLTIRSVTLLTGQCIWLLWTSADMRLWDPTAWIPVFIFPKWGRIAPIVHVRAKQGAMAAVLEHSRLYTGWYSLTWLLLVLWRQNDTQAQAKVLQHNATSSSLFSVVAIGCITVAGALSVLATYLLRAQTTAAWIHHLRQKLAALQVERLLRDAARRATSNLFEKKSKLDDTLQATADRNETSGVTFIDSRDGTAILVPAHDASSLSESVGTPWFAAMERAVTVFAAAAPFVQPAVAAARMYATGYTLRRAGSALLSIPSNFHGPMLILATMCLAVPLVLLHNIRAGCLAIVMIVFLTGSWFAPSPREGFCTGVCRFLLATCVAALAATSIFATESHGEGPYAVLLPMVPAGVSQAPSAGGAYTSCSANVNGLTLVEHCMLAASAYGSEAHIAQDLETWFSAARARGEPLKAPISAAWVRFDPPSTSPLAKVDGPMFFALYNNASNALHIVVRGTATAADWGEDMDLWQETALWQLLGLVGPYGAWPLSTQQALIRSISDVGALIGGISLHHPDAGAPGFSDVEGGAYHADLLLFVKRERARLPAGATVSISGHSLGGGLATIVGRELGIRSISFAGPGLALTGVKLGFSRDMSEAYGDALALIPDHDLVSRVDSHTGSVQHVRCRGATGAVACHSITRLCCELVATCGDAWGRSLKQCPLYSP